jgi:hypothetical protein
MVACSNFTLTNMKHTHHIIPKHMGGTDDPSNLVELTVEEHAEAHRILFEQYGKWQDNVAWKALSGHIGKEEIIHEIHKNMNKGRIPSIESREKMAAAKRGRKISESHKKALNEGRRNSKNSAEHNEALRKFATGRKMTDEAIKKSVESRKQNNDTSKLASIAGKASMEKYRKDPERQKQFSEKMKLSWAKRKQESVGT